MTNTPAPDAKTSAAALAALLFLAAVAAASVLLVQPPRAVPTDAPPAEFSSGRALAHVREIARAPHPTGSEEIERVRAYVVEELRELGVAAEIQTAEVVPLQRRTGPPAAAGRVRNIVARVPGTSNSKALMLAAHYDSVPTAPGATDDGAGVAALLETLRALKTGPPLRNDLILLFTDAEELGLIGARAFADEHPWMKDVGLVLNFEGRGAGGPSMMFETSRGNGALVRELGGAAPHTIANSLMYAVYERLPNDTDMTVFKRAGAAGLNFAYAERITHYHTMLDSAEELDERSLQHHGSYALALARRFGELDLRELKEQDATYFNFGPLFVRYSEAWAVPLTALVAALFVLVVGLGRRAGRLSLKGVAAGFFAFLLSAVLTALAAGGVWRSARGLHEGYASLPHRTPYDLWQYEVGFLLLSLAVSAAVYALLFRKTDTANLFVGALAWWLLLLLATTALLPAGSFLFAWPLLFVLVGAGLVFARRGAGFDGRGALLVVAACATPGVVIVAPLLYMFFMMLGMELVGHFMLLAALLAALLVPHLRALVAGRRWLAPAVLALAGLSFVAAGVAASGFDARHKKANNVFYFLDADSGAARWLSGDAAPDEWTSQFAGDEPKAESLSVVFPWVRQRGWQQDAPAAALPAPVVEVLDDRTVGETRTVRLRVASRRGAPMLLVYADPGSDIRRAYLNGRPLVDNTTSARGEGSVPRISYAAPPAEGFELTLEARASNTLRLTVQDVSFGLPALPGLSLRPRPDYMMPAPSFRGSDTTVVGKTFQLEAAAAQVP